MKSKFEIGDKVKFLNQIGGGVVTKVTDDFVFVQDDTGFDIPVQPEELIRMADQQGAGQQRLPKPSRKPYHSLLKRKSNN